MSHWILILGFGAHCVPVDVETIGAGSSIDGPKIDRSLKTSQLRAK